MTPDKWNGPRTRESYAEFCSSADVRRRLLLDRMIRANEPLVITIAAQLSGRKQDVGRTRPSGVAAESLAGIEHVEWDDIMQAGRMALKKAIEQWSPDGGAAFSTYLRPKIFYELQCVRDREYVIHASKGHEAERPAVARIADQETLDALSPWYESIDLGGIEGVTTDRVAEWTRTGDWPESLEDLRDALERERQARAPKVFSAPRPALDVFLSARCVLAAAGRVPQWDLWQAFRSHCGDAMGFAAFARGLARRGARTITVRNRRREFEKGFAGVRMVTN